MEVEDRDGFSTTIGEDARDCGSVKSVGVVDSAVCSASSVCASGDGECWFSRVMSNLEITVVFYLQS